LNASIQNNTLKRLGIAISWFLMVSLFSSFTDLISFLNADGTATTCNTSIFSGSLYFLNAVAYFVLRLISGLSAVWLAIYLFYKQRTFKKKKY
tara:strand:+ start:677 stop:955 length:279 start_codon:yes stop_codon:yes gene_type:complete